jgi:hypothetical protein
MKPSSVPGPSSAIGPGTGSPASAPRPAASVIGGRREIRRTDIAPRLALAHRARTHSRHHVAQEAQEQGRREEDATQAPAGPIAAGGCVCPLKAGAVAVLTSLAPSFSLADEARWQAAHRSSAFFETGKSLRSQPIQFVSAGQLLGTIKYPASAASESDEASLAPSPPWAAQDTAAAAMAHMAIRSPSPAASEVSSSGDEVVFRGRGQPTLAAATVPFANTRQPPQVGAPNARDIPRTPQLTVASTDDHTSVADFDTAASVTLGVETALAPGAGSESDTDDVVQDHFAMRRRGKPVWEGTTTPWQHRSKPNIGWLPVEARPDMDAYLRGEVNPRSAAMDDYMQNLDDFGLTGDMMGASGFARREMDLDAGSHNDWESASGSQLDGDDENGGWDSDMLQDFDGMSTSSDVMDTVVRILSKRTRTSGLHYLCVYEGAVPDDARWLPANFLARAAEKELIRAFEEAAELRELAMVASSNSSGEDDDDEEEDEEGDEDEEEEDDEELDDETIARVLQKQEELGLGSDEVLLYGGDEFFAGSSSAKTSFRGYGRPSKNRQARVPGNRDPSFPSASAMVDALAMDPYAGFDIMDTERPSLKPKKKGRRGQMPPELEDADLNEQLQNSWAADRAKKRVKKAEREEQRQQGLLGRKGKSANVQVKYKGGFGMDDILEEVREFLLDDRQTLSLPPMDSQLRAMFHQISASFGLNSRSRGDGQDRFTIFSKTSRTPNFTDAEIDRIILKKGFHKRLRGPLQNKKGPRGSTFRSGNRVRPQVGYQDGETVGANAPELGPENRGHALMMKMGWAKGKGLGAGGNEGILQPIAHTVKTNKAGLQ